MESLTDPHYLGAGAGHRFILRHRPGLSREGRARRWARVARYLGCRSVSACLEELDEEQTAPGRQAQPGGAK